MLVEEKKDNNETLKVVDNKEKETQLEKDVEANNKEDQEVKDSTSIIENFLTHWQLIVKVLELLLCIVCFYCYFRPVRYMLTTPYTPIISLEEVALTFFTFAGYILINGVLLTSRLIKDPIPFRVSAIFSAVAAILCFVASILMVVDRHHKFKDIYHEPRFYLVTILNVGSVLSFITILVFAVDCLFTLRSQDDF